MKREIIVTSSGPVVLSDKAVAFKNTPAPMPVVEDIYSVSGTDRRAWIVVCTEFACEAKAEKALQEAKIATFLPIERAYVRKQVIRTTSVAGIIQKNRTKTIRRPVDRPLLPGYLFVQVPAFPMKDAPSLLQVPERAAARVAHADGVSSVLGREGRPLPIPTEFVEILKRQQGVGAFDRTKSKPDWAKKGARVRIADGPFATFLGIVEECMPNHILKVAVEIFGRATPVSLELAQVEKL